MNKPISELRLVGSKLGREGMSDLVTEFINECDGTPKGVMILSGKLSIVAKMATCDEYWLEQVERGIRKAVFRVEKEEC
jgi:hypothetical protein